MKNEHTELIIGYLQGSLSKERVDFFYDWVNKSTDNKELFFEVKKMYDVGMSLGNSFNVNDSWLRLLNKKTKFKSREFNLWYRFGSYAAVALIAAAISSLFILSGRDMDKNVSTKYIGGNGVNADIVELPDGTRVSLGSGTIFYCDKDYEKKQRIVYLEGEAYFEVAKRKGNPFIVKTKEQNIEVLGTKFNVKAYPLDSLATTTLLEGSVRLSTISRERPTVLKPNQQVVYNRNTKTVFLKNVDAQQYISWTVGYYYFSEQSLKAILERLSHVYGARFTVNSEKLNNRTFTGTFYYSQSLKDLMEIINLSIPIKYDIKEQNVVISE